MTSNLKNQAVIDAEGVIKYYNDKGQLHREEGPAVDYTKSTIHGGQRWFFDGQKHRVGGPAVIHADGTTEWWIHGKRHNLDGPAILNSYNESYWYYEGERVECSSQEEFEHLIKLKVFW